MNRFLPYLSTSLPKTSWSRLPLRLLAPCRNPIWLTVAPAAATRRLLNLLLRLSLNIMVNPVAMRAGVVCRGSSSSSLIRGSGFTRG